jgi:hypothetical protein
MSETPAKPEEAAELPPQGDVFEDQYTSATADLSAGGVAVTEAAEAAEVAAAAEQQGVAEAPTPSDYQTGGEPWSEATLAHEGALPRTDVVGPPPGGNPPKIGVVAAALLSVGSAIGGAWLYSRWQRRRRKPINRLRRRLSR